MNAILSTINAYWQDRSDREQIMLALLSALVIAVLGYMLLARPLLDYHDRSRGDYLASMRLYRSIEADAAAYQSLGADNARRSAGTQQSLRSVAGSLALTNGISIARMIPGDDGSLTVNIEQADTAAVMRWLVDLEQRFGIQVDSSTMDRIDNQRVQASLVLRRSGGN